MLLTWDRRLRTERSLQVVLDCLCREQHTGVIAYAIKWLEANRQRMRPEQFKVVQLAALRCPWIVRRDARAIAKSLPDPVRCRVFLRDPLHKVAPAEVMSLIEERLAFLVSPLAGSEEGPWSPGTAIGDFEPMAREIYEEVLLAELEASRATPENPTEMLTRALRFYRQTVEYAQANKGWPLQVLGISTIDWFIKPLAMFRGFPALWPEAHRLALIACDAIANSGEAGAYVAACRIFVEQIDGSVEFGVASSNMMKSMFRKA